MLDAAPFLAVAFALALALQGGHIAHAFGNALLLKNTDVKTLGLPEPSLNQPLAGTELWVLLRFSAAMIGVYVAWTAYRVSCLRGTARRSASAARHRSRGRRGPEEAPEHHASNTPMPRTARGRTAADTVQRDRHVPLDA